MKVILRDYQTEAINSVLNSYKANAEDSAVLYLCTGAGKTIISSELTRRFLDDLDAKKIMFIVHRDELVKQTIKKMQLVMGKDIIRDIGIVKGEYNQVGRKITIASIQSLLSNKRLNQVKDAGPYDLVIVDEFHHYSENLWRTAVDSLKPTFEVGLTATPNELENKYLEKIVFRYSIFQAIKERNLVDIKGLKIKLELNLNKVKVKDGDYSETQIQNEMMRPDIMQKTIETYKNYASNRKTVIFCVNVLHAQTLCNLFKVDGISAECITGETPTNIRDLYYADFASGKIKVLLSVNVLTEGWDETSLDCVIMARPTLSETLYIQCIGRGLRIHPGKTSCLVIDLVGNSDIHKVMQLGVLFGKQPKKIKETTDKLKELGIDPVSVDSDDEIDSVRDLITKEEEFGLHKVSEERKFDWIQFEDKYCLSLGSKFGFIIIEKNPKEFNMFSIKRYYSKGWKDRIDTLCEDIPLDWAINMSEQEVQGIVPASSMGLIDKSAEWKGGSISDKQREILIKFGVKDIPNSKGQASKLISELIIKKQVKDYEVKANKDNEGKKTIEQIKGYIKTGSFLALDKERASSLNFEEMSLSECKRLINFNNIKLKQF